MEQILIYGDSLAWGIVPGTRQRLVFTKRWPGIIEHHLNSGVEQYRIFENCLNGRSTVWDDPFKAGRNGAEGLAQVIEMHSPLKLVIVALGTNDFQSVRQKNAWASSQGIQRLIQIIQQAPIEPTMAIPKILVVPPPTITESRATMAEKFAGAEKCCVNLDRYYREVAVGQKVFYADIAGAVTPSSTDGVHLDEAGHRQMAELLIPFVRDALAVEY